MRYLVIAEMERTAPMPPDQLLELVIASLEAFVAHEKAGKVITCGIFAGRPGGFGVVEAESHEDVDGFVRSLPFWGLVDWEVIPLVSMEKRLQIDKEDLARMKAQKK